LMDSDLAPHKKIWVLEPRRLAARSAARHIAATRGEKPGDSTGWALRFSTKLSAKTRLVFSTPGVLLRRLQEDPELSDIGVLVFDEFHERSWQNDLLLSLLYQLRKKSRPDLKILVMSATVESEKVAHFLDDAPMTHVPGRLFPVKIEHLPKADERWLEAKVRTAFLKAARLYDEGHILVFLPGKAEIRRASEALSEDAKRLGFVMTPLHGELSPEGQDQATLPSEHRKLILSTNVAETSVTIEGVRVVIDSGLVRMPEFSPWTGLATLKTRFISQASAIQRAGRAGRTADGICLRLYTQHDFETSRAFDKSEILRSELSELLLLLWHLGYLSKDLEWLDAPPEAAINEATKLLLALGVGEPAKLNETGRSLSALPAHPRLGRVLVEAKRLGVARQAALAVAILNENPHRCDDRGAATIGPSDILQICELVIEAGRRRYDASYLRRHLLHRGAVERTIQVRDQLFSALGKPRSKDDDDRVGMALLTGFPDRVARWLKPARVDAQPELLMAEGGRARLSPCSIVHETQFGIALQTRGSARKGLPIVDLASSIEVEWLAEFFIDDLVESENHRWNER
ncbi:ATP-dependent RNA helicase, partial [Myxococcota bacterium]|nr:ATP-dependent RNA helicase [Myxococcota bacterium]